jgi:hypothetical protein
LSGWVDLHDPAVAHPAHRMCILDGVWIPWHNVDVPFRDPCRCLVRLDSRIKGDPALWQYRLNVQQATSSAAVRCDACPFAPWGSALAPARSSTCVVRSPYLSVYPT